MNSNNFGSNMFNQDLDQMNHVQLQNKFYTAGNISDVPGPELNQAYIAASSNQISGKKQDFNKLQIF